MKKVIAPVLHHDVYTQAFQKELVGYFSEVLIAPLESELAEESYGRQNSVKTPLQLALLSGVIWYADGRFHGAFSSETSAALAKMGAKHNRRSSAWTIPLESVPLDVRQTIYQARDKSKTAHKAVAALLLGMLANVDSAETGINLMPAASRVMDSANAQFNKALRDAMDSGEIPIPSSMKATAEEINEAVKVDAKRIMREEIEELLAEVKRGENNGEPLADLKKSLEKAKKRILVRIGGTSEHAAALLLSEFRYAQAMRLGANSYIWQTKLDNRVRHDHRLLEGKTFTWDNPPVTNQRTGETNNPGHDHGCRCTPRIIINA